MAERIARRVVARGVVQGVFFRDSTRREARSAGVHGWVRNASDGTVQAHLEGPPEAVERVLAFMRDGPPDATVENIEVMDVPPEGTDGFEIR
jgi:acylphosphatase